MLYPARFSIRAGIGLLRGVEDQEQPAMLREMFFLTGGRPTHWQMKSPLESAVYLV